MDMIRSGAPATGARRPEKEKAVFANPACNTFAGHPVADSPAMDFLDDIVPEDRPKLMHYYNAILHSTARSDRLAIRIRRSDLEERVLEMQASVIRYRNKPAVLVIMCDTKSHYRQWFCGNGTGEGNPETGSGPISKKTDDPGRTGPGAEGRTSLQPSAWPDFGASVPGSVKGSGPRQRRSMDCEQERSRPDAGTGDHRYDSGGRVRGNGTSNAFP